MVFFTLKTNIMEQDNKNQFENPQNQLQNDITGKPEQSEAEIAQAEADIDQTEDESHNKGARDVTPEGNTERPELKEAPESLKNSK
jgi:hypothetical protein